MRGLLQGRKLGGKSQDLKYNLLTQGGLTFLMDFEKFRAGSYSAEQLMADHAVGDGSVVCDVARSASNPATYVDEHGVLQLVTESDTARITAGYWDDTGFNKQKGFLSESTQTNYVDNSCFVGDANSDGRADDWELEQINGVSELDFELIDVIDKFNVNTEVNAQRIYGTESSEEATSGSIRLYSGFFAATQGDQITISFWVKGSLSGCTFDVGFAQWDSGSYIGHIVSPSISISETEFTRVSRTLTVGDATTNSINPWVRIHSIGTGDSYDIQIACPQVEKYPYATSFIPTTVGALTRNTDGDLEIDSTNNVAPAQNSVLCKFAPYSDFTDDGVERYVFFLEGDTSEFYWRSYATSDNLQARFLEDVSSSPQLYATTTKPAAFVSQVYATTFEKKASSSEGILYRGGSLIATDSSGPANEIDMGTLHITQQYSTTLLNGVVQRLAVYNNAKSGTAIKRITEMLEA